MDLEHARLVLRGDHGLVVDRGRIVREAVAVVLADLEAKGESRSSYAGCASRSGGFGAGPGPRADRAGSPRPGAGRRGDAAPAYAGGRRTGVASGCRGGGAGPAGAAPTAVVGPAMAGGCRARAGGSAGAAAVVGPAWPVGAASGVADRRGGGGCRGRRRACWRGGGRRAGRERRADRRACGCRGTRRANLAGDRGGSGPLTCCVRSALRSPSSAYWSASCSAWSSRRTFRRRRPALSGDRPAFRRLGGVRRVLDPFGAVAAALGGVGWGVTPDIPLRSRGRLALALLSGPVAVALAGMLALLGFILVGGPSSALPGTGPGPCCGGSRARPVRSSSCRSGWSCSAWPRSRSSHCRRCRGGACSSWRRPGPSAGSAPASTWSRRTSASSPC